MNGNVIEVEGDCFGSDFSLFFQTF